MSLGLWEYFWSTADWTPTVASTTIRRLITPNLMIQTIVVRF